MLTEINEDYEYDREDAAELPNIEMIHTELIDELILDQVDDPFVSKTDYVTEYFDIISQQKEVNGNNPDVQYNLDMDAKKFCTEVIKLIDDKYDLDIDFERLDEYNLEQLHNVTEALYRFFVLQYGKNVKKFFVKFINKNITILYDAISSQSDRNDVITNSMKSKIRDSKVAIIISNLSSVIDYIIDLDLNGFDMLSLYNPDKYDIYILTELMTDFILPEDKFGLKFFDIVKDQSNEYYTDIYVAIESSLIKKFKKEGL